MKKTFKVSLFGLVLAMLGSAGANAAQDAARRARQDTLPVLTNEKGSRVSDGDYVLVNSLDELVTGRNVIIAASAYNYAMSATQKSNNRARVAITKTTSGSNTVATWSTNVGVFTLATGTTTGTYAFYDANNSGYLTAVSSTKNYLRTSSSLTANASFEISFSNGAATLTSQGSYTRNQLKYNTSSGIFSCYSSSSSQKAVAIYQQYAGTSTDEGEEDTTVAVTGVSLNATSASLEVGGTKQLTATVTPSNATNKNVTWSSSNTAVATVDNNGLVTAVAAGSAKVTVTTKDGSYTAQATITVTEVEEETEDETTSEIKFSPSDFSSSYSTATLTKGDYTFYSYYIARYSTSYLRFYKSYGYIQNSVAINGLKSITLETYGSKKFSGTLYSGTTAGATTHSQTVSNGNTYNFTSGDTYFKLKVGSSTGYLKSITLTYVDTPVNPTSISLTPSTIELAQGGTQQLAVEYLPTNANANLDVTYNSSNTSVATVSSTGLVTVGANATAGATATITATSTYDSSIKATAKVTVKEVSTSTGAEWTIMIYMCGADLESTTSYRLASGDITEILNVSGQPENVNIIIETGGASSWASTHGISANYLQRWHVENQDLVLDSSITKASMGLTSTFQSFLEWGLTNYPAEKTGVIMWNHGGAMRGVCYDENYSDDCLLNSEVSAAVAGAFSSLGRTEKLEFIGYDACLMQVQDIAEFNSSYFNYMVASEESEAGYGWDYDTWVDDLYSLKGTTTILKAIVDGFITDNGGTSSSSNDQTLSYLDLSYMDEYKKAWENMASALSNILTSSNKSSFNTLVKGTKYYAGSSSYQYYGIFDAKDFVNKLAANSTFNPGSTYTNAVLTAFANLVAYSSCGKGAGNSYGLCMFWAVSSNCVKGTYYTSAQTNFSTWRSLVSTYGN